MIGIEDLRKAPPSGLSIADQARLGSARARERIDEALNTRPPSGLSRKEWAKIGLPSVQEAVDDLLPLIQ